MEQHSDVYTALEKILNGQWIGVVYSNYITVNYFNLMEKSWDRIGYTQDLARLFNPTMFFNKHTILMSMFNQKIEMSKESGLISYWAAQYRHQPTGDRQRKLKRLSIQNILAILQITAVMYSIAIMVFLLEILSNEHEAIRKCLDYLTY